MVECSLDMAGIGEIKGPEKDLKQLPYRDMVKTTTAIMFNGTMKMAEVATYLSEVFEENAVLQEKEKLQRLREITQTESPQSLHYSSHQVI